jgi:ubiquinone/menaquinone biosynthesis C-methylase UbiE
MIPEETSMADEMRTRFASVASNYVTSSFHASPERLEEVVALCEPRSDDEVIDVATGTGNTALALAPHVRRVVGLDLTPEMLAQARLLARERELANTEWQEGDAEALPFAADSFDLWTARAAPHHFHDLQRALGEAWRVLRPGGRAVVVDCSPPPAARDLLHRVEVGRDPSHVLSRTLEEWRSLFDDAGFRLEVLRRAELDWDFEAWNLRIGVPPEEMEELAAVVESAEGEARDALLPERRAGKLWHRYWHAQIRARKPA